MGCIVFGPREDEVIGEWRKPYVLNNLYCSPKIVRVITLRGIRSAGGMWGKDCIELSQERDR